MGKTTTYGGHIPMTFQDWRPYKEGSKMRLSPRKIGFLFAPITLLILRCGVQSALMKTNDLDPDVEIVFSQIVIDSNFDDRLRNLLNEQSNPVKPSAIWCSDLTYIDIGKGFAYLTSIMDLFPRRIIAWRLSSTLEAQWVVECVLEVKELRRPTQPLVLHSDRGFQYVSGIYLESLKNIMPNYSRKASPCQNACIES